MNEYGAAALFNHFSAILFFAFFYFASLLMAFCSLHVHFFFRFYLCYCTLLLPHSSILSYRITINVHLTLRTHIHLTIIPSTTTRLIVIICINEWWILLLVFNENQFRQRKFIYTNVQFNFSLYLMFAIFSSRWAPKQSRANKKLLRKVVKTRINGIRCT